MRRILTLGLLLLSAALAAQEPVTTHPSVTAYLQTLLNEPVDTINLRVDRFIESVGQQQPELQSKTAGLAFDYFTSSPVMGHEAVAVHIADNWFLNGRLKLENEELYPILYTFAEFNRSSLIGMPAQPLVMEDPDGQLTDIRSVEAAHKILFFYDTECATCRKEAPLLAALLQDYQGDPITFFAIYTQSDREAWEKYIAETFGGLANPAVRVIHLWDPEAATGYHKKYAVLSTPMLFLLDSQNIIRGRGLDSEALAQMLSLDKALVLQYKKLFDNLFSAFEPLTIEHVEGIVDAFGQRTEGQPALRSEVFLQLFNYLRRSDSFPKQQGALYLAEKYIVGEPDGWSQEFVDRIVLDLSKARLNPAGEKATMLQLQNKRGKHVPLYDNKHFGTLIFFHLIDCQQCQKEFEALKKLRSDLYDMDIQVVLVYVGQEKENWRKFVRKLWPTRWKLLNDFENTSEMRTLYDLEYVPHLYLLDENGVIIAKDISVSELKELLPLL